MFILEDDEELSINELLLLKESYREALAIKDGTVKALSASELWND